jgi:PilZ domain-containing protein
MQDSLSPSMQTTSQDRRKEPRIRLSWPTRVCPLDSQYSEEVCTTENVSKNGLYFKTSFGHYYAGMNVSVARNFQPTDPIHCKETAKVVRVERLKDGRWGVAIRFL